MLKALKNMFHYDNASSVSDFYTDQITTTTTNQPSWVWSQAMQNQQAQAYQQKMMQWQQLQQQMGYSSYGSWGASPKEKDRELLEKVRCRAEHYAMRLLQEVGCA